LSGGINPYEPEQLRAMERGKKGGGGGKNCGPPGITFKDFNFENSCPPGGEGRKKKKGQTTVKIETTRAKSDSLPLVQVGGEGRKKEKGKKTGFSQNSIRVFTREPGKKKREKRSSAMFPTRPRLSGKKRRRFRILPVDQASSTFRGREKRKKKKKKKKNPLITGEYWPGGGRKKGVAAAKRRRLTVFRVPRDP